MRTESWTSLLTSQSSDPAFDALFRKTATMSWWIPFADEVDRLATERSLSVQISGGTFVSAPGNMVWPCQAKVVKRLVRRIRMLALETRSGCRRIKGRPCPGSGFAIGCGRGMAKVLFGGTS